MGGAGLTVGLPGLNAGTDLNPQAPWKERREPFRDGEINGGGSEWTGSETTLAVERRLDGSSQTAAESPKVDEAAGPEMSRLGNRPFPSGLQHKHSRSPGSLYLHR